MTIKERNKKIIDLRTKRFTLQEIGDRFGITRERVRQIEVILLKRTTTKNGKPLRQISFSTDPLPIEKLKILTKRKRNAEGMEKIKYNIDGGGRNFIREIVRARDKYTCQDCGKKWKVGQRRLDVHHLDKDQEGRSKEKGVIARDKKNLHRMITLCHKCHYNRPEHRVKSKEFSEIHKNVLLKSS